MRRSDYRVVSLEIVAHKDEVEGVCDDLLKIADRESHLSFNSVGSVRKINKEEWDAYKKNLAD